MGLRKAVVAGSFYPKDKEELRNQIKRFLEEARVPEVSGKLRVLILPHAGYLFSGKVAGFGFKLLSEKLNGIKRVILIGPSHHYPVINKIVADGNELWETPLGKVKVDREFIQGLIEREKLFEVNSRFHLPEHCLEVEIPFLQVILEDFKIVPLLVSELGERELQRASETLAENMAKDTLLITSSDMSHYPPYEEAIYADKKVISAILSKKVKKLEDTLKELERENILGADTFLCGETAVKIGMKVAEFLEAQNATLLKYANSGDSIFGDKSQVVGYCAVSFSGEREGNELIEKEKEILLKIAKTSIETFLKTGRIPKFQEELFFLNRKWGAFVTLKKQGRLRGCIGTFTPTKIPLYEVVSQMAISAAVKDGRFFPVTVDELDDLEYEISVLGPLRKIKNWREIKLGKEGVLIKAGIRSGVFLPQVAIENNWDLETFLSELCYFKVGLERDCYKREDVELYVFDTQVFSQKDLK